MAAKNPELIAALGADSVTTHKGGFKLLMDGKTVAYGQELAKDKGVRLRVLAEALPKTLTKSLKVKPIAARKQLSVYVTPEQVALVRPILEHVAAAKATAKATA